MRIGEPVDRRIPWVREILDLNDARASTVAGTRLRQYRRVGTVLGDSLRKGPKVLSVTTLPVSTLIYPVGFAFNHTVRLPWPYLQMNHRCLFIQVRAGGEIRNVLFNPTDYVTAECTPFFAQIIGSMPRPDLLKKLIAKQNGQVDEQLRAIGVKPEDIDVVAFDHFHTQDLRPILGSDVPRADGSTWTSRFPNAILLAPRSEWDDWDDLHPLQRSWFVAEGKDGVPEDRVVLFDADLRIGEGCLLLRTPGHTSGNQTIFVHGRHGVFGCSENGCSADSWTPYESSIPGLRAFARRYDAEVVLNTNTPELMAEQYNSMILEKSVVDRSEIDPAFVQMFPSSEVTPSPLAPGIRPTMRYVDRDHASVMPRDLSVSRHASV